MSDGHPADDRGSRTATLALLVVADVLLVLTFAVVLSLALESKAGVLLWVVVLGAAALTAVRHVQFVRSARREPRRGAPEPSAPPLVRRAPITATGADHAPGGVPRSGAPGSATVPPPGRPRVRGGPPAAGRGGPPP